MFLWSSFQTRSEAVAMIADCTVSQHLWRSRDVTWPFVCPYVISYWWSFGTVSLNPIVFEILRSKRIGATSLTFQGHVTSSSEQMSRLFILVPIDFSYTTSYRLSIVTFALGPTT